MPSFTHQGLKLHYRDVGEGPPVLLLHAFPLSGAMFEAQVAALSSRYRFIIPDLRGFGGSDVPEGISEMATFAADALALLDHLDVGAAVVGGVSMGGYAAIALLEQDPGRVQALVLADTQMAADDEAGRARREDTARSIESNGMAALASTMLPKLLAQPTNPEIEWTVRGLIERNAPAGAAAASRGMALRSDGRNILARFAGPALLLVGQHDAITPRAAAERMADVLSRASVVEIEGAGHLSNLEAPVPFNAALDEFLAHRGPLGTLG